MKKDQAFAAIQAVVRLADDDTVLYQGSDLLKSMLAERFPDLKKFIHTGYHESEKLNGIVADDSYTFEASDKDNLYLVKVEGNNESITFQFLHEQEGEYKFFGTDNR